MISKEESLVDNELIYINRNLPQLGLVDRFIFLVSRLYKNFYDGLQEARTRNGVIDNTFEDNIENENFLNKYGNERIKKEILNILSDKIKGIVQGQFYNKELINLSTKKISLINNKEHLLLAPFLYNIHELKRIIIHELSLSRNEDINIEKSISFIKSILSELILRIDCSYSWDVNNEEYRTFEIENEYHFNAYTEEWEDSGHPNYTQIEIAQLLGVEKRATINLNELIIWVETVDSKKIEKLSKKQLLINNHRKLEYKKSPLKLKELIIVFFNINNIEIDNDKKLRVSRFIMNCFDTKFKNYSISSQSYESINFLNKKILLPFISLLIYLHKKECLKINSAKQIADILISELKHINAPYIGLSNQLRDKISQGLMTNSTNELVKLTGFKYPNEINIFLKD
ncbi:hypothetical protein [Tenacibaculum sp.]|uniref:hypothetical protein n=1 Tax=Tenacibaculum sp. TaxID=1906242 RepID=UPI003D101DC5